MRCKPITVAAIVLSSFSLSCGLFETRDAENPNSNNQTLPPPYTADALMANFISAFESKNVQEYEKLFSDTTVHKKSFVFVPSQNAQSRYSSVFVSWDKTAESDYFKKIVNDIDPSSSPQLSFVYPPDSQAPGLDSTLYTVDYTIFVPHKRSGLTTTFIGRSEFYLSPNKNNVWMIYRWIDFETRKDSSWSELKGQFYSK